MSLGPVATASRGRHLAAAVALLAAGCITTYEDAPLGGTSLERPEFAVPLAIPFPTDQALGGGSASAGAFYRGMLDRLQTAAKARDADELESLLVSLDRPDLPAPIAEHVRGYRAVARGLRFCQHATATATLTLAPVPGLSVDGASPVPADGAALAAPIEQGVPALGAPLRLELRLPAPAQPVRLGGEHDEEPIGFAIAISVGDVFVDGSTSSPSTQRFLWLPAAMTLQDDAVLRLPISVELPGENAVRRDVVVRVDLMPGYVRTDAGPAPVPRTTLAATALTQWPVGYGAIVKAPLQELRAALRAFGPRSFARAFLAAGAVVGPDRELAIELLVEQVRFGRPDQALVAMAALRAANAAQLAIGDREAWLEWWNSRR